MGWILRFGHAVAVTPVTTACGAFGTRGSGRIVTEPRPVRDFDQVTLKGIGTLRVSQGETEALTIEAEDNIIPHISTDVTGSRLTIDVDTGRPTSTQPTRPIVFTLRVKTLRDLQISGTGEAEVSDLTSDRLGLVISGSGGATLRQLQTPRLDVQISGACRVHATGAAADQSLTISGSGTYRAVDLASDTASVTISGSGDARLRVEQRLSVRITGSGKVQYAGNAAVDRRITGSGSVRKIPGS